MSLIILTLSYYLFSCHYLMYMFSLSYVQHFSINNSMWDYLIGIILCTFSYYSRVYGFLCHYLIIFRITFAYTIPRLSYVHFLFILCTTFPINNSMWDYLLGIILCTFSYYSRVYGTYIILCTFSYRPYPMHIFL